MPLSLFRTMPENMLSIASGCFHIELIYMGDKVKSDFQSKIEFINYLRENLGSGNHRVALLSLKEKFGTKKGMSSKHKEQADRIIQHESRKYTLVSSTASIL